MRLAALGLALGLVAAACGDDSDSGSSDTTAAATTAAATTAAATTAAGTTAAGTTEAATTTEAEPMEEAYAIADDRVAKCPAEATAPLADGDPIKVAFVGPQTGPLAGFGLIAKGLQPVIDEANAAGGIDGHQIELIVKDDAYDAARTTTAVQELLEKDKITMSLLQVGTPNVASVRQQYEDTCTPQAFVGTGFPAWGDPANFPFTVGGILAYNTEAKIWDKFISENYPEATVGVLTYNNDFGKAYSTTIEGEADEYGFDVTNVFHEATSTLNNEITQLLATAPDVIVGATTATFCGELVKQARQGGFEGPIIVSSTCFSSQFLDAAGEAAVDVYGAGYLKDPTDPQYADDEAVQDYLALIAERGATPTRRSPAWPPATTSACSWWTPCRPLPTPATCPGWAS